MREVTRVLIIVTLLGTCAQAQETHHRITDTQIHVVCAADAVVIPDKAEFRVLFQEASDSRERVAAIMEARREAFLDSLAQLGISRDQIDDHRLEISEHRPQPDSRSRWAHRKPSKYFANQLVLIYTSRLDLLNAIYRISRASGATEGLVHSVTLTCTDATSARQRAFEAAYKKAETDARVAATSSGYKLGLPVEIEEHPEDPGKSVSWNEWELQYSHGAPYEMTIWVTVAVTWKLVPQ